MRAGGCTLKTGRYFAVMDFFGILLGWVYFAPVTSRVSARQPSYFFLRRQKKVTKKKRATSVPLRGALRYSQRSGHLQTRFAQTVQVPSSERCSVAQHVLMAVLNTTRLVRFANFARMARSLRSPRGGWVASLFTPHPSLLVLCWPAWACWFVGNSRVARGW